VRLLRELADQRHITAAQASLAIADASLVETLYGWAQAGWLHSEAPYQGTSHTDTD